MVMERIMNQRNHPPTQWKMTTSVSEGEMGWEWGVRERVSKRGSV